MDYRFTETELQVLLAGDQGDTVALTIPLRELARAVAPFLNISSQQVFLEEKDSRSS